MPSSSFPPDTPYDNHDDLLTLTQKKAHADEVQALGRKITELSNAHFDSLPLDGRLREALVDARRISHRGGRVRQLQFVGRLMRSADVDALRQAIERGPLPKRQESKATSDVNRWVQRLLQEGRPGIEAFLVKAPDAERTRLAQLTRQFGKAQTPIAKTRAKAALEAYVCEWRGGASDAESSD
jgi:ribosome-associated protein